MSRPRRVAPGVELFPVLTPTLPPATHTNSYALGSRQLLLVEPSTPYDDERRAWVEWARALASSGRELIAVFATHHHADHVGGAAFLARELGLEVWAHRATAERAPDVPVSRHLDEGEVLVLDGPAPTRLRVLHTPGHAPGHLCLLDEATRAVVAGDMVASVGTILIEPRDGHMATYLASLRRLRELDASVLLPAHGEPIEAANALLNHYVAHRLAREAKVLAALPPSTGAPCSVRDLVPIAYADTPAGLWPLAALSLEAHLVKLEEEGRAVRTDAGFRVV